MLDTRSFPPIPVFLKAFLLALGNVTPLPPPPWFDCRRDAQRAALGINHRGVLLPRSAARAA
ncbi:hypothetical protein A0H81_06782 [Grifola frondosa]|uniref:Uncharacterized protein n=1 Tax=Grifola frondosa TaxID=5627 RepID=A0A1C7M936_GRIFR|nr:hypothetical protein A0H81_06782 [Grifola frondosa]